MIWAKNATNAFLITNRNFSFDGVAPIRRSECAARHELDPNCGLPEMTPYRCGAFLLLANSVLGKIFFSSSTVQGPSFS